MTKPSIFRYEGHNYLVPFLIISSLFFMWGFAHGILEVLNPHFQESFHISKAMSALTQTAVYGAYFLMALPAGWIIRKWGYRRGVITGLVLFGIGALMFIPGSRINSFYFFVLSLFVIGCGLTCLETSANPYTTVLGHPDKAESRINLSQSLNGIGWIVGPLVGGQLLFSGVNIAIPYALVGIFVLAVALVLSRIKLPDPRRAHEADTNEKVEEKPMRVMAFGFGMLALFLYVAAQTGVNSFFINYAEEGIHIEKQTASLYLAFGGMGLFFIGRLAGGVIMNYIQPRLVLLVCAILTFVATLIVVVCSGTLSLIAFFALYLGESIMFPTIFSLALRDAGTKTKLASSLLIMTIVGGAVAPIIMGYISIMSRELITKYPAIFDYSGIWMDSIIHKTRRGESQFDLVNTNKFLNMYTGATGLKTGFTNTAKYCMSATAERDGIQLIAVIMGADTKDIRNKDACRLLDYGYSMCQKYTDLNILQEKEISIDNGTESCVTIKTDSQFTGILLAGEHAEDVKKKLEMRDPLTAPVDSGEELGKMSYYIGERCIGSVPIYAAEKVDSMSMKYAFVKVLKLQFTY